MTRDYIKSACVSHYHVIATIEIRKRSVVMSTGASNLPAIDLTAISKACGGQLDGIMGGERNRLIGIRCRRVSRNPFYLVSAVIHDLG